MATKKINPKNPNAAGKAEGNDKAADRTSQRTTGASKWGRKIGRKVGRFQAWSDRNIKDHVVDVAW